ncbi:hypothetical protein PIB30_064004 [Stylosanthes scabra]|uniref:Uncharacterized protein n=1 Tax=Stylosanthes scabra TaxID=79078 RepID=A0ABU6XK26_9FABA|nr:hypothetical protein [Stylosanthes scabra]
MEAESIDTLLAQNKALAQQINLINSKLGTMQLAATNTQIGPCDLCRIQGHSSETCAAILEQQSSEQVNYMANAPRQPNFDPHSKTYNPVTNQFLATGRALIDVEAGELTLRVHDEQVIFNVFKAMRYPQENDAKNCMIVDLIESAVQEVFEKEISSNNEELSLLEELEHDAEKE